MIPTSQSVVCSILPCSDITILPCEVPPCDLVRILCDICWYRRTVWLFIILPPSWHRGEQGSDLWRLPRLSSALVLSPGPPASLLRSSASYRATEAAREESPSCAWCVPAVALSSLVPRAHDRSHGRRGPLKRSSGWPTPVPVDCHVGGPPHDNGYPVITLWGDGRSALHVIAFFKASKYLTPKSTDVIVLIHGAYTTHPGYSRASSSPWSNPVWFLCRPPEVSTVCVWR